MTLIKGKNKLLADYCLGIGLIREQLRFFDHSSSHARTPWNALKLVLDYEHNHNSLM